LVVFVGGGSDDIVGVFWQCGGGGWRCWGGDVVVGA
jgi:hypothetical protein